MLVDFHTHIFPGKIRVDRETYFPGEPAFKLLYGMSTSKLEGASEIIDSMDANHVDKSVVFGFPWKKPDTFVRHNDYIMEAIAKYSGRLIGFGCFDPLSRSAASEAERCLGAGLSGIGELAFYESGIDGEACERLAPVMAMCAENSVPVLIHTNEPVGHMYPGKTPITLSQIYHLVERYPENRIVLAHWGGGLFFYTLLKKAVRERLKNVYVDTAASPFLYHPEIHRYARDLLGLEKILFGSDFPLISPSRYFRELEDSGLSADEIKQVCGLNAEKLLRKTLPRRSGSPAPDTK